VRPLLFDAIDPRDIDPATMSTEQMWTTRDRAMAANLLSALTGSDQRCIAVAGNAHTGLNEGRYGRPMGAWLADDLPGLRSITVAYGSGKFYNAGSRTINSERHDMRSARLYLNQQLLLLDLPGPAEAVVPH
jgi:erythromycin esterase-like protein